MNKRSNIDPVPTPLETPLPKLLTTRQAIKLTGIAERTLWRYSRFGLMPSPRKINIPRQKGRPHLLLQPRVLNPEQAPGDSVEARV